MEFTTNKADSLHSSIDCFVRGDHEPAQVTLVSCGPGVRCRPQQASCRVELIIAGIVACVSLQLLRLEDCYFRVFYTGPIMWSGADSIMNAQQTRQTVSTPQSIVSFVGSNASQLWARSSMSTSTSCCRVELIIAGIVACVSLQLLRLEDCYFRHPHRFTIHQLQIALHNQH